MTAFVLVGGAWLGGWAWRGVARRLREQGHDVYPVTLTGLGERVHLARPEVDLETHIADVVNLLEYEDLRDAVLVAHSYGGVPVTGAADRAPERLARVVYVDSGPIPAGMAYLDTFPPEQRRFTERLVAERGDGWRLPALSWQELETVNGASLDGLDAETRAAVRARMTPQPFATYTQPLRLDNPAGDGVPVLGILNSFSLEQVRELVAAGHPFGQGMAGPTWRFLELPTGHWPMFSRPDDLAALLLDPSGAVPLGRG